MKKSTIFVALAFCATSVVAQDLTSKKGEPILPEAGDWALVIDAKPVLQYAGGFLSNAGATPFTWNFPNSMMTITGKMFIDEKTAYRAKIRIGFGSDKDVVLVNDVTSTTNPVAQVEDVRKSSYNAIALGAGMEWRRGKTRLQGFYGGEALISFMGGKTTYEYGNALSSTNTVNSSQFGQNSGLLEDKQGSTFGIGLRGFIGAEYFIFPKMSIGGEFGWGLTISSTGEGEATSEAYDSANNSVTTTTTATAGGSNFALDTDNMGGMITLGLHF